MKYLELKAFYIIDQPIGMIADLSSALRGLWGRSLRKNILLSEAVGM